MIVVSRIVIIFLMGISVTACSANQAEKENEGRNEIIKTDKEFSKLSSSQGMKKAFIEFIDDEGILLRPDHMPIIGANAIEYLTELNDSSFTLTWVPYAAQVAASGDLGYSYGIYKLQLQDTTLQGTYVNIWKKQKDGTWKFILDSGNQGISNVDDSLKSQ